MPKPSSTLQRGREVPRPVKLHRGGGQIVEEASFTGTYVEPAIQLLEYDNHPGDKAKMSPSMTEFIIMCPIGPSTTGSGWHGTGTGTDCRPAEGGGSDEDHRRPEPGAANRLQNHLNYAHDEAADQACNETRVLNVDIDWKDPPSWSLGEQSGAGHAERP